MPTSKLKVRPLIGLNWNSNATCTTSHLDQTYIVSVKGNRDSEGADKAETPVHVKLKLSLCLRLDDPKDSCFCFKYYVNYTNGNISLFPIDKMMIYKIIVIMRSSHWA